jgi:diketogulonate reductase-like aldo/keto reductase
MHWPNPDTYMASWRQMEEIYQEGLTKAIGVCNFHKHHLEKLLDIANVVPAINQVELHPLLSQVDLVRYCTKNGIRVSAYSPLARMNPKLVENPVLQRIAGKYHKTVPQVILRWNFQNGIISVPKTSKQVRLRENLDIFDFTLTHGDISEIGDMNENFRVRHNPDNCDFSKL